MRLARLPILLGWLILISGPGEGNGQNQKAGLQEQFERGRDLYLAGSAEEARRILESLLPLLGEDDSQQILGDSLNMLSLVDSALGDYTQAFEYAQEAARVRSKIGDSVGVARSINNMGLALQYLGEYEEALTYYQQALAMDRRNQDLEGEILRLNNIGNIFFFQASYLQALRSYQQALVLVDKAPDQNWKRRRREMTIVNLAVLHQKLGQYRRALELHSQLQQDTHRLPSREEALLFTNLGALYRHLGDPHQALEHYQKAQQLFRSQRDLDGEIGTLKNMGIVYALDLNQLEESLQLYQRILETAQSSGNGREELQAHLYMAEVLRRLNRSEEANEHFGEALQQANQLGTPEEEWKAHYGLGMLAEDAKQSQAARDHFEQAVAVIESARSRLQLGSLQKGFLAEKRSAYDALIGLLIREPTVQPAPAGRVNAIAGLIEKARAETFSGRFAATIETRRQRVAPEVARTRRQLKTRIADLWALQLRSNPEQRQRLQAELAELQNQYLALEPEIGPGQQRWPGLERLQQGLDKGTLVVTIWMDSDQLALLWITRTDQGLWSGSLTPNLNSQLRGCIQDLTSADLEPTGCQVIADMLGNALKPLLAPEVTTLIIVPDRLFAWFPFEILRWEQQDYLIERLNVFYAPSASMLIADVGDADGQSRVWPWSSVLLASGAPSFDPNSQADRLWPALAFAEQEIREVDGILPGASRLQLGADAQKQTWIEAVAKGPPIIHLATHAALDRLDADRSRIVFAPESGGADADYLFLGEIATLDLPTTELVTLSACETARGSEVEGEGVHDFGQAFLLAGVRSTLATLWKVSDEATYQFMREFYSELARGRTLAEALRTAKIRFIRSETGLAHPYYWSAFVLYGQGNRPVSLPYRWITLCAALTLILVAAAVLLRWRFSSLPD